MNAKVLVRKSLHKIGLDVVPHPLPDWVPFRDHLMNLFTRLQINCVLDVGAHFGEYGSFLRRIGFEGWILSFEPVSQNLPRLKTQAAKDPRWRTYPFALGEAEAALPMNVAKRTEFSSFLAPNDFAAARFKEKAQTQSTEMVPVRRLDSVIDEVTQGIDNPRIYLKLDTQGYDAKVVAGGGDRIADVLALQSEISVYNIYSGMTSYLDSMRFFADKGFVVTGLFPVNFQKDGVRVVEFDCVMVRDAAAVSH